MHVSASPPPLGIPLGGMVTTELYAPPLALARIGGDSGPWIGLGLGLLVLLVLLAAGVRVLRRRRRAAQRPRRDPLLVFPMPTGHPRRPAPLAEFDRPSEGPDGPEVPEVPEVESPPDAAPPAAAAAEANAPAPPETVLPAPALPEAPPTPLLPHPAHPGGNGQSERVVSAGGPPVTPAPAAAEPPAGESDAELVDGRTIRFYRPIDGNLQLLPGRLEIVEGDDRGQEIRFVRVRGTVPEVTFGRSVGPPHRHVQLRARTVSREHARMNFDEERWWIHNLSRTNPIVVNGRELDSPDEALTLRDGDLIEMGEVVFRFHEHG